MFYHYLQGREGISVGKDNSVLLMVVCHKGYQTLDREETGQLPLGCKR